MNIISLILQNLKPGITVALVSIPLSIAISIASGAGPVPGIITGFWATIIAGIFGGSNYNIIGPAGALTSILFGATLVLTGVATPWILPILAILTGIIIFIVYAVRGERFIRYIPGSVIHGFAAGVAFVIASTQLREALGVADVYKATGHFFKDLSLLIEHVGDIDWKTTGVFLLMLVFLLVWKKNIKKIPGVIPATLIGIALGFFTKATEFGAHLPTIFDRYGKLDLSLVQFPNIASMQEVLTLHSLTILVPIALVTAVIAILETLITARIGDQMTNTRFDVRKETLGLSLANIGSGIMGGLPSTGVFIRTGLNIKSGATHKTAQVITGIVTGLGSLLLLPFLQYIPMAIIAAVLCMTALGLVDIPHLKHFWKHSRSDFWIAIMVIGLVLLFDPGVAVAVGVLLALLILLERITDGSSEVLFNKNGVLTHRSIGKKLSVPNHDFDTVAYSLSGFVSYVDAQLHSDRLHKIAEHKELKHIVLRMRNLDYCDDEALGMLERAVQMIKKQGIDIHIASVHDERLLEQLCSYPAFENIVAEGKLHKKTSDAVLSLSK